MEKDAAVEVMAIMTMDGRENFIFKRDATWNGNWL
jgi:hypothetical protein